VSGTSANLFGVTFANAQRGWAVGFGGTIRATDDGGDNWAAQASGTVEALVGVSFVNDARTGWAVGFNGTILATGDGGANLAPQESGTRADLYGVDFANAQRGWAVGAGGIILATRDGGATWAPQASGTPASLYGVKFADAQRGWAVGAVGIILTTGDGGATWAAQASGTGVDLRGVAFADDARSGWAVGDGGTILATGDGGTTWASQWSKWSGTGVALRGVDFAIDARSGWAVGDGGTILRIEAPDTGALVAADSPDAFIKALEGFPDLADARNKATELAVKISAATDFSDALRSLQPPPAPHAGTWKDPARWENWVQRAGVILLLMFLVAIFSSLYRYSLRMAAFYDGRADALILDWLEQSSLSLAELAAIFGPEGIDFAKARSPADHVVDLAKTALQAAGRGAKA
jgi:photosystem II stability/assembly factor-like uncharacterized protein